MLDSMLPQEIQNMTGVTYSWTILVLSPALGNIFILAPLAASLIPTGTLVTFTPSYSITNWPLAQPF